MTVRVIADVTEDQEADAVLRFRAWMRDPDTYTFIVHKVGAHYQQDGREMVIGIDGEPRVAGVACMPHINEGYQPNCQRCANVTGMVC